MALDSRCVTSKLLCLGWLPSLSAQAACYDAVPGMHRWYIWREQSIFLASGRLCNNPPCDWYTRRDEKEASERREWRETSKVLFVLAQRKANLTQKLFFVFCFHEEIRLWGDASAPWAHNTAFLNHINWYRTNNKCELDFCKASTFTTKNKWASTFHLMSTLCHLLFDVVAQMFCSM